MTVVASKSVCIAICTYNRAASLKRTLATVARLRVPEHTHWQLLVVDNNSSDETATIVHGFADQLPLRLVHESQQGLSHARNRAVAECTSDWLLFSDDDVLLDPHWLEAMLAASRQFPEIGFVGGRVYPAWPNDTPPAWFREESLRAFGGLLVTYDQGDLPKLYDDELPLPIGASMGFRLDVLRQLGSFRTDLGTCGKKRGAGEDTEMLMRARTAGVAGCYVPTAICRHFIEPHRLTLSHAFQFGIQRGRADVVMHGACAPQGSWIGATRHFALAVSQTVKWRGDRVRLCLRNAGVELGRWYERSIASEAIA